MATQLEKEIVKEALRELIIEDKSIFRNLLIDILQEENLGENDKFQDALKKNFKRFEETFIALA